MKHLTLIGGPASVDSPLARVRGPEGRSGVQSRLHMQECSPGLLTLLAEPFGEAGAEGTSIDVRITHAQLAAAVGATRAPVTRLLGPLRRQGPVPPSTSSEGERDCPPPRTLRADSGGHGRRGGRATPLTTSQTDQPHSHPFLGAKWIC
ncbi:MAG: helix-turn-helix domain-containing protein [Acidobacteriota bacterium]